MFQVIATWNLARPDQEAADSVGDIALRGYNPETFLTGEFARRISLKLELDEQRKEKHISRKKYETELKSAGAINPLSVGNIADKYCPARRDLYFDKGINRPSAVRDKPTWGRVAGHIVEKYLLDILGEDSDGEPSYSSLIEDGRRLNKDFLSRRDTSIRRLKEMEKESRKVRTGDSDWVLKLLNYHGRAELGSKLLHSLIKEDKSLDQACIQAKQDINPNTPEIGISSPASPDFIVADFCIVGDIKTGVDFKDHFLLTCAGYALAYENQHRQGHDINWGIIYFFPTRIPTEYVRPLTFAQIYIFPVDDNLRSWFINVRDEAYNIVSKPTHPGFPPKGETRTNCRYCRFKDYCTGEGLELGEYG